MESNWNQLIERYLQKELSDDGRVAFEQELQSNPDLQMEFELHNLIYASTIRSVERAQIAQIGRSYHFYKFYKMVGFCSVAVIGTVAAVWFASINPKTPAEHPQQEIALVTDSLPTEIEKDSTLVPGQPIPAGFDGSYFKRKDISSVNPDENQTSILPPVVNNQEKPKEVAINPPVKEKEKEKDKALRSLVITTKFGFGKPIFQKRNANYLDFQRDGEDLKKQSVYTDEEGLHIVNPEEKLHFVFERNDEPEEMKKMSLKAYKNTAGEPVEDTTGNKAVIRSVRND